MTGLPTQILLALCGLAAGRLAVPTQDPAATELTASATWTAGVPVELEERWLPLAETAPEGVDAPPGLKVVQYATWPLGEQTLQLAFDLRPDAEELWLDREFDGKFLDDEGHAWVRGGFPWSYGTEVELEDPAGGPPLDVRLEFRFATALRKKGVQVEALAHRTGRVELGGRERGFAVVDLQSRLRFDAADGVVLLIDVDDDGRFDAREGSHERIPVGGSFLVGAQAWSWQVLDPLGRELRFAPAASASAPARAPWIPTPMPPAGVTPEPPEEDFATLEGRLDGILDLGRGKMAPVLEALGALGSEEAFTRLDKLARDRKAKEVWRLAAIQAMGNAAYRADGDKLRKLALDKEPAIAVAAMKALHAMDWPEREEVYLKQSKSRKDLIARAALAHLAYLGSETALGRVNDVVGDAKAEREVRIAAYDGLRTRPEGPPRAGIEAAAGSEEPPLCARGLDDLFQLEPAAAVPFARDAAARKRQNPAQLQAVVRVLGAAADRASILALLEMDTAGRGAVRGSIQRVLSTLRDDEAIASIAAGLDSREPATRSLAASVLASIDRPASAEALSAALGDEREEAVQQVMIEALGGLDCPASRDALLAVAKSAGPLQTTSIAALGKVAQGDAGVRDFLAERYAAGTWEERSRSLAAAASSGDVELGRLMVPALEDERWQVRLAAIEGMRTLRARDWVEPLIAHLDQEPRLRLRMEMGETLFQLTGQNSYWDSDTWRTWWSRMGDEFEMPATRPRPPKNTGGDTVVGAFFGVSLDSDQVIFVIDKSGSMREMGNPPKGESRSRNRLEEAIDEVLTATAGLEGDAQVNVIMFSSGTYAWKRSLTQLNERNRSSLETYLRKQRPDGGTMLFDALAEALETEGVDKVLLLSDGDPSEGSFIAEEDILREVRRINAVKRIAIDTISLGGESRLLRRLAEENEGTYAGR
ncbi:MAG: VWA domain-containing protein [Planctomycetota bacterium]|jgi:HEAT repeat protein